MKSKVPNINAITKTPRGVYKTFKKIGVQTRVTFETTIKELEALVKECKRRRDANAFTFQHPRKGGLSGFTFSSNEEYTLLMLIKG